MKLLVYTVIFGDTDSLKEPDVVDPEATYVCFTNRTLQSDVWNVDRMELSETPVTASRRVKMLCPLWEKFDASLYVDASFRLKCLPSEINPGWEFHNDMVTLSHYRRRTIEQEAIAIARRGAAPHELLQKQVSRLRETWPEQHHLTPGGFLLRRHARRVRKFNEHWFAEFLVAGHARDQMCIDYCIDHSGIDVMRLPYNHTENPFASHSKC